MDKPFPKGHAMEKPGRSAFRLAKRIREGERKLRKAKDICGLPVIEVAGGRQLGTVKDILIDPQGNADGVLMETKMWFSSARWIPWEQVLAFGEDAVTISDEDAIAPLPDKTGYFYLQQESPKLAGLPIMTVNGQQLGIMEDVYFSAEMDKRILGFELSEGFLIDLKEGRKWLPAPRDATLGADVILVPVRCQEELEQLS
jgi:uncharacterized protein YrrD